MKSIYGKKIGMTHIFDDKGKLVPVTVVVVGPCIVTQVKTVEKDGYAAIQIGLDEQKPKRVTKPLLGHFTKNNLKPFRLLREIRTEGGETFTVGQTLGAEVLEGAAWVDVTGVSKGKGFQGVIKRHKARGGDHGHGSMFYRAPGSIGASSDPSRVLKGVKMPGQMGNETVTAIRLKLVKVDTQRNLLLIRGAVPGANRSLVCVQACRRGGAQ
jgi:large subunit ribosomal protein L3